MTKEFIAFTKATIHESYNVDVEIKNDEVIFPKGTSEYTVLQVNNFWKAILEGETRRYTGNGYIPR
ncbi:hypothetical protein FO440_24175 [Mucilaginibacter corticis]|uniref:Uncharacterized protein n=1 Tax=Mucilaginibacter corticis TaxID=2597670 RepID=A0A556M4R9_9SPHI|nr:hypothetical protein [Mucilaginibacter corticis]TSJ34887.1 hypothetical protein FO440_24225 [Mucilaginibacter corticis]TSJ34894.1 hypothetical protein FO440_24175 [Mucilaginibacter corticis]